MLARAVAAAARPQRLRLAHASRLRAMSSSAPEAEALRWVVWGLLGKQQTGLSGLRIFWSLAAALRCAVPLPRKALTAPFFVPTLQRWGCVSGAA